MTIDETEKRVQYFISQNQDLLFCSEEVKAYYSKRINEILCSAPLKQREDFITLIQNYVTENISENYRTVTNKAINDFYSYLIEKKLEPLNIKSDVLKAYIKNQYDSGKSQNIMRVNFSRLNKFYQYLESRDYICHELNPFNSVSFSDINYNKKCIIPSEEEILKILDSLPLDEKTYFAIFVIKGYSYADFYDLSFNSAHLKAIETDSEKIRVIYTFTQADLWDYLREETAEKNARIIESDDIFSNKVYYEYISTPEWYRKILNKFWTENIEGQFYQTDEGEFEKGVLYYLNEDINIRAYERKVQRKMEALYKNGELSYPYKLKDIHLYTVKKLAEQTGDLTRIQSFLKFSTPNATRRFLQNNGIKFEEKK